LGQVVDINSAGSGKRRPTRDGDRTETGPGGSARGRRSRRPRTALVLGGGGLTGAVYEIGALRALDLLAVNKTVNDFDIVVGTSAGAFVGALTANGITPEQMMRVVNQQDDSSFPPISLGHLLRPNIGEFVRKGIALPWKGLSVLRELAPRIGQFSIMDVAIGLAEGLPAGLYTGEGVERYVRTVLSDDGRTDDFRELRCELYLVATDLDTCERIVFGAEGWDDVPISTAVRASTALPMVYNPVEVRDRVLVDGGLVSTTNLDIAVEAGAEFIVVVNPLVPYINDYTDRVRGLFGSRPRHVSDMGLPQIGYQAFKMMAYQRLHEMAKSWEERYPGVDIILVEPEPDDELMFSTSIMNFSKRVEIARHGFQSVTLRLADEYDRWKEVCDRHGIRISAERVRQVVKHFAAEQEKGSAWRKILERPTRTLLRQSGTS